MTTQMTTIIALLEQLKTAKKDLYHSQQLCEDYRDSNNRKVHKLRDIKELVKLDEKREKLSYRYFFNTQTGEKTDAPFINKRVRFLNNLNNPDLHKKFILPILEKEILRTIGDPQIIRATI